MVIIVFLIQFIKKCSLNYIGWGYLVISTYELGNYNYLAIFHPLARVCDQYLAL